MRSIPRRIAAAAAREIAVLALLAGTAAALQWRDGALDSELGAHADEPAHCVTGLMVFDYFRQVPGAPPMRFAREYYAHYPKVALGHWPPAYYVVQAAWFSAAGASRGAAILLAAVFTALLGYVLYRAAAATEGRGLGIAAALLLVLLPVVRTNTAMVMEDIPVALFVLLALLALSRFVETGALRSGIAFAVLASAAALTKGNALCLAAVLPVYAAVSGRWAVLARRTTWIAMAVFAGLTAPWYIYAADLYRDGLPTWRPGLSFFLEVLGEPLYRAAGAITVPVAAAAIVGILRGGRTAISRPVFAAFAISFFLFHAVTAKDNVEPRYLIMVLPGLVMFAVSGVRAVAARPAAGRLASSPALAAALLLATWSYGAAAVKEKAWAGYGEAWALIDADSRSSPPVVLVCSDEFGEGIFVCEAALHDRRPRAFILRATKVLATANWAGDHYRPFYRTAAEVDRALRAIPVGYLLIDASVPRESVRPYQSLVAEAAAGDPSWERIASLDVTRDGEVHRGALWIFRFRGPAGIPGGARLDMRHSFGEAILVRPPGA